ncbi:uncharacterized protein LOC111392378 [Olea europaea var. sylvestris]|uniref:uncharacterized protein LOC111392378 n=1 Tax=Olea europaea var. sylvestris TaxID=158386 RepID=UPI000C1D45CB|nr:uncharacterized protein LOC111392378 [Olea europaea var. sylvestris]
MKDQIEESMQEKNLACEKDEATTPTAGTKVESKSSVPTYVPSLPFPSRFAKSKKDEHEKEILEAFRRVQVNIPLLDAIYQVPCYAKFLKDLCTNKHRLKGNGVVSVGKNVSAVLQKKLPPKCKDPRSFTIPCIIGNTRFEKTMLDLGACINVMPYSIYASLNLGSLKETSVFIQLADRSNAFSKGVLGDVLVQVNQLIFPADFYVLDMQDEPISLSPPLLLGRPFMRTVRTKIDVHDGTLTMEFDDSLVQKVFELSNEDALDTTLIKSIDANNLTRLSKNLQAPTLELKPLPKHLKYVYLGEGETLLVIIAKNLTTLQEDMLIRVLKEHKIAIGWTIADIKGISSSMCMHWILLEDGAKPSREAQRRLNPPMMEVVK